jgi:hypothetical protein
LVGWAVVSVSGQGRAAVAGAARTGASNQGMGRGDTGDYTHANDNFRMINSVEC